jgi:phosphotransacetylase
MRQLPGFDALHDRADARAQRARVVVAGGHDETVLAALRVAVDRGWTRPCLVGPEATTRRLADDQGVSLEGMDVRHADEPDIAEMAVALVRAGGDALMKGRITTPDLMKSILDPERGLRTDRIICQVVLMEILRDERRFLLADTGISVHPNLAHKTSILQSAVGVAQALGLSQPRVALMAATETAKDSMPETLHAQELSLRQRRGELTGCLVQGPLSFDLAYARDAGDRKRIDGPAVGAADVMIFPDLCSANLTVKAIMYTADCRFGGLLRGTSAPVVFMSRADSATTRLNSLALTLAVLDGEASRSFGPSVGSVPEWPG